MEPASGRVEDFIPETAITAKSYILEGVMQYAITCSVAQKCRFGIICAGTIKIVPCEQNKVKGLSVTGDCEDCVGSNTGPLIAGMLCVRNELTGSPDSDTRHNP